MTDLTRAIVEALRKSRALQSAMAFGVPEGAHLTCLEAIADDIAPLIEARAREARADAWDEGHAIGAHDQVNLALLNIKPTPNPYRKDRETRDHLPLHRTEAGYPNCATCDGGGCHDCTDPA